jgi:nitrite reductase/ring-hydroxylating ferredoxin subunit
VAEWLKVCQIKDLKESEPYEFDHEERKLMLIKIHKDIFATDRICTHAYADLTNGFMNEKERTITCPLHMSSFRLSDGVPLNLPAEEPLKTYQTKIENGSLYVLIE